MIYGWTDIPEGANAREWFEAVRPPARRRFTLRSLLRYIGTRVRR